MKHRFVPLLLLTLSFISCQSRTFTLTGTLTDTSYEGATVYLQAYDAASREKIVLDSAVVSRGTFVFEGNVSEKPDVRFICIDKRFNAPMFILEKGDIHLQIDSMLNPVLSGAPLNEAYQEYQSRNDSLIQIMMDMSRKIARAKEEGSRSKVLVDTLSNQYQMLSDDYQNGVRKFIQSHLDNPVGWYLMQEESWKLLPEWRKDLLESFDPAVKSRPEFQSMKERLMACHASSRAEKR
jgi:hypothetical protein